MNFSSIFRRTTVPIPETTTTITTTTTTTTTTIPITEVAIATPVDIAVVSSTLLETAAATTSTTTATTTTSTDMESVVQGTPVEETKEGPEALEKTIEKMKVSDTKQLDLVFLMDCTGSMGSYIQAGKENIQKIVSRLHQEEKCDTRFGLIAYRDHPPQDSTFVTRTFDFTTNTQNMQKYLDCLSASGGGDGPEAVTAALHAAEHLEWRPNAAKIAILIADAPPHGLGESGDGFPNGDPDGHDPLVIARSMASKGITIYPVGCEPALSAYRNAKAFMVGLAEITDGYATSLSSSSLLAEIILGGAAEEIGIQNLAVEYEKKIISIKETVSLAKGGVEATDAEVMDALYSEMQSKHVQTRAWKTDGKIIDKRGGYFSKNSALSEARKEMETVEGSLPPPPPDLGCGIETSASADGTSKAATAVRKTRGFGFATTLSSFAPHSYSSREDTGPRSPAGFLLAPMPSSHMTSRPTTSFDDDMKGCSAPATTSIVETEDVSYEHVQRVFNKVKKQGKI